MHRVYVSSASICRRSAMATLNNFRQPVRMRLSPVVLKPYPVLRFSASAGNDQKTPDGTQKPKPTQTPPKGPVSPDEVKQLFFKNIEEQKETFAKKGGFLGRMIKEYGVTGVIVHASLYTMSVAGFYMLVRVYGHQSAIDLIKQIPYFHPDLSKWPHATDLVLAFLGAELTDFMRVPITLAVTPWIVKRRKSKKVLQQQPESKSASETSNKGSPS